MLQNIVFDFGGVLLNLDESRTIKGLQEVLDPALSADLMEQVIHPYERGEISEEAFFNRLQRRSVKVLNGDAYFYIWNAMLLDMPEQRLNMLRELRKQYKLYLLSNTNITHVRNVFRYLHNTHGVKDFGSYFQEVFLSHDIHLRKPDQAIYEYVIHRAGIDPALSLFIDDKPENTEAASACGFRVWTHDPAQEIADVISHILQRNNV
ncbi:MAG: HAD family phosphatase [Saprospiraceae bacterium]